MLRVVPLILASVLATGAVVAAPAAGAPAPEPYGTHDGRGFLNILPPGQNGLVNSKQLAQWELNKSRPPHNDDQLGMYANLVFAVPGLKASQVGRYYKDATFGVKPADVYKVLATKEMQDRLAEGGSKATPLSPREFAAFIKEDTERWAPIIRASGARVE